MVFKTSNVWKALLFDCSFRSIRAFFRSLLMIYQRPDGPRIIHSDFESYERGTRTAPDYKMMEGNRILLYLLCISWPIFSCCCQYFTLFVGECYCSYWMIGWKWWRPKRWSPVMKSYTFVGGMSKTWKALTVA
jgi:hypothetical protein